MDAPVTPAPQEQVRRLIAGTEQAVEQAQSVYLDHLLGNRELSVADGTDYLALGLETVGIDLGHRALDELSAQDIRPWRDLVWPAYRLRRAALLPVDRPQPANLGMLVREAVAGLVAQRQPELRYHLRRLTLEHALDSLSTWDEELVTSAQVCFLLLARRHGLQDADRVLDHIASLRGRQEAGEASLLSVASLRERQAALFRCMAAYHALRAVELATQFVIGSPEVASLSYLGARDEVAQQISEARTIIGKVDAKSAGTFAAVGEGLVSILLSSTRSLPLPPASEELMGRLASRSENPVLEFWQAQRDAMNRSLLDPTKNAVVLSMPTSSGKTLLAELRIAEAIKAYPERGVLYLAPTRALVSQVALTLRKDFSQLESPPIIHVASPGYELDPIEDAMLSSDANVLVTTPEKADLLFRMQHRCVSSLSLVVVDEAQLISDGERGSRLELLLAAIRRERRGCKFLLLTPFARNAKDLATWLGDEQSAPIYVDWKPNDCVIGGVSHSRRSGQRRVVLTTLSTARSDFPPGIATDLGPAAASCTDSKKGCTISAALALMEKREKGVLLLSLSRKSAQERAEDLAEAAGSLPVGPTVDLVARYVETEAGGTHPLATMLRKGVAFHHAGLSTEARYLVERLVENGEIRALAATTTLAQGVHFPLSAVVIENHKRNLFLSGSGWQDVALQELWNIAGRVGRTLEDPLGTVAFAATDESTRSQLTEYLRGDAETIASSLLGTLRLMRGREVNFTRDLIKEHKSLSAFLQYVLHAVAVSGIDVVQRELTLLLRGSFAFQEAQREDPELADELVRIGSEYLQKLSERRHLSSYAKLADGTGFSSPSVDYVLAALREELRPEQWQPDQLLRMQGEPSPALVQCIRALGGVPEVEIGDRHVGDFSPERIARVVGMWVNGKNLNEIAASEYNGDVLAATGHIYSKLTSAVPWGIRSVGRIVLSGRMDDWGEADLMPAMVLYGVRSKQAIAVRMVGAPRFVSEGLGRRLHAERVEYSGYSQWLGDASAEAWQSCLPSNSRVTGAECKRVWQLIEGQIGWMDVRSLETADD